ncbi:uncharacterized protein METZ01_LOCUS147307 [marine metagenome]|jgi:hypothetical protein|uniref:Neck protein n=1 Tax=marine metagenome TaxID=408172 RepID=A0A382A0H8_9ZZZZ|tara:strand:- start:1197 stop:2012 length:816 start_codon:yes stop_codon:yes gene_type:complete
MASPNSKATLKEYIKRRLGAPVLEINVEDDQFDDRMDEALQYFREYHYDGSIKCYLKHKLTSSEITTMGTNETHTETVAGTHAYNAQTVEEQQNYVVLPEFVLSVIQVYPFNDKHNLNMFDLRYQLRLNDIYDLTATNILHYEMVQQQISLLDQILVGRAPIRYNMHSNRLYIDMDMDSVNADEYILIEAYRKIDPTNMTDVYNDMWLKRYATALVKFQWGENLSKFSGVQLPGGVELNAEQMKTEAQEEITRLEEESRLNYELPVLDMIG